jgi:integrase
MSAEQAAAVLGEVKRSQREGGSVSLAEMRAEAERERQAAAAVRANQARAEAELARVPQTFGALAERYLQWAQLHKKSWGSDRTIIRNRLTSMEDMLLRDIDADALDVLRARLEVHGYAPATVRHALGLVRRVWNWAAERYGPAWTAQMPSNPTGRTPMPRVNNRRLRYLSEAESRNLLAMAKREYPFMHDIIYLGLYTGLRRNEIRDALVGHVDLHGRVLNVVDPKSGSIVEFVTMPAHLVPVLTPWVDRRRLEAPLFPGATGGLFHAISAEFRRLADVAGLNDDVADRRYRVTFHTLRHTYVSWLVLAGVDLATVKRMARHRSFEMTLRYAHLAPDGKHQAAGLLPVQGGQGQVVPFPGSGAKISAGG